MSDSSWLHNPALIAVISGVVSPTVLGFIFRRRLFAATAARREVEIALAGGAAIVEAAKALTEPMRSEIDRLSRRIEHQDAKIDAQEQEIELLRVKCGEQDDELRSLRAANADLRRKIGA
jgi:chromosome segregation ATPase